jgi:predicted XRE-type DNA-binding protein
VTDLSSTSSSPRRPAVLQARAELLMAIGREISARGWTPAQAARHLELSTARVRQLVDDGGDFDARSPWNS